jgi:hypothetical protein
MAGKLRTGDAQAVADAVAQEVGNHHAVGRH